MVWLRRLVIWLAPVVVLALFIGWQPDSTRDASSASTLALPDVPPDLYIQDLDQTRFDETGKAVMHTQAVSLAYYEDREESLIDTPVVLLLNEERSNWHIVSKTATLHNNGDTIFEEDVVVSEQVVEMPAILETQWLKVEQEGAFATTPRPVKLTQGPQLATGVGMDAELASDDPVIKLKSEVAIRYEAESR